MQVKLYDKDKNIISKRSFRKERNMKDFVEASINLSIVKVFTIKAEKRLHYYINNDGKAKYLFSIDLKDLKRKVKNVSCSS